ncbi:MAG: 1-deoxy-D-xylulose-5-phosphate synthase [Deltaproteobacteria bacterium]|nr:1-deoxy-D-xylulose-5-phosphate synthase [Deltaproteobacteria bacterium]
MILDNINNVKDIKKINLEELNLLATELRKEIISVCSKNGGHLASSLGVVELTISMLKSFDIDKNDKIIWDVGHQSYAYKLLTGRRDKFNSIRKLGGLSGFPSINESKYDFFGTGHAGTSISAALGMAVADDITKKNLNLNNDGRIIAVIGDASISNGLALEGLNHAGAMKKDIIVILNDNEMSISKSVGAFSNYLNKILTGEIYIKLRNETEKFLKSIPLLGLQFAKLASKIEELFKNMIGPGIIFEELGFTYIGPIDGHNIEYLTDTFENIKKIKKPILLHIITQKGKGYKPSEKNPSLFHGISAFDENTGIMLKKTGNITLGETASNFLIKLAKNNKNIIAITAAMTEGTGLSNFAKLFPERFFDVGIQEEHAVTFSAGAAANGLKPFFFIYSTFLQRSLDQIIHDVCLQNLPVVFCIDRAGIAGEDGVTHQGIFDLSFLGYIPNLVIMCPKDADELIRMVKSSISYNKPVAIRYPKSEIPYFEMPDPDNIAIIQEGEFETLIDNFEYIIVSIGIQTDMLEKILNEINTDNNNGSGIKSIGLINARFVSPISENLINKIKYAKKIMTVEENVEFSGFGSKIITLLSDNLSNDVLNFKYKIVSLGNNFIEHGSRKEMLSLSGFSEQGFKIMINEFFFSKKKLIDIRYSANL